MTLDREAFHDRIPIRIQVRSLQGGSTLKVKENCRRTLVIPSFAPHPHRCSCLPPPQLLTLNDPPAKKLDCLNSEINQLLSSQLVVRRRLSPESFTMSASARPTAASAVELKSKKRKIKNGAAAPTASSSKDIDTDIDSIFSKPVKAAGSASGNAIAGPSSRASNTGGASSGKGKGKEKQASASAQPSTSADQPSEIDGNPKKKKKKAKQPASFDPTLTADDLPTKASGSVMSSAPVIEVVDTSLSIHLTTSQSLSNSAADSRDGGKAGKKRGRDKKEVEEDKLFRDSRGDSDREC